MAKLIMADMELLPSKDNLFAELQRLRTLERQLQAERCDLELHHNIFKDSIWERVWEISDEILEVRSEQFRIHREITKL